MSEAPHPEGGPVRPPVALAFATVGFAALLIFGFGITSLVTGEDVIATPGLGQIPGATGVVVALLAFAGGLWTSIRHAGAGRGGADAAPRGRGAEPPAPTPPETPMARSSRHPSYGGALWTALASFVAYLVAVWIAALATGADLAVATGVVGRLATSWFGLVVAAAAFVSAWAGIALVRTRARRPRWPWEDEFDE